MYVTLSLAGDSNTTLLWRHNGRDGVSNHQPNECLFNRSSRRRSKKHQSSASLAFVRRIHRRPVNSLYKWIVTRKMFPFDHVIMTPRFVRVQLTMRSIWSGTSTGIGSIQWQFFTWHADLYALLILFLEGILGCPSCWFRLWIGGRARLSLFGFRDRCGGLK